MVCIIPIIVELKDMEVEMSKKRISSTTLINQLFIVEDEETKFLYAPLDITAIKITEEAKRILIKHFHEKEPNTELLNILKSKGIDCDKNFPIEEQKDYKPTKVTFSLTSRCNLRCTYCYARAGNLKTMSFSTAKLAIDYIIQNAKDLNIQTIGIDFLAGGESLLVFKLLKQIVEYAKAQWGKRILFSIVTNGTLISEPIASFLTENQFGISVSLDGPEDLHNKNRPKTNGQGSFEECVRGIRLLSGYRKKILIRSTITSENINYLNEIVRIAKDLNCRLKLEPVTPTGSGADNIVPLDTEIFIKNYLEAKSLAQKIGVELSSTYDHDFSPRKNFCAGNGRMFCVLPEGQISSCSRVTREDDCLANLYFVGNINPTSSVLDFDRKSLSFLNSLTISNFPQCFDCFAKWYCAGGCHATRLSNNMEMPEAHCEITKRLLWENLKNHF